MEHSAFSESKSEIKTIEAIRYGCIPIFSHFGGYKDFWKNVPKELKINNIAIDMTSPGPWQRALEYWVQHLDEGKNYAQKLKAYSDDAYDINKQIENRIMFLHEKIEQHSEEQVNSVARYLNYNQLP